MGTSMQFKENVEGIQQTGARVHSSMISKPLCNVTNIVVAASEGIVRSCRALVHPLYLLRSV